MGTVVRSLPVVGQLLVRLDDGRLVGFNRFRYAHVTLGYALTTQKAQGLAVDHAFVYLQRGMSRELAIAQASIRETRSASTPKRVTLARSDPRCENQARKDLAHDAELDSSRSDNSRSNHVMNKDSSH